MFSFWNFLTFTHFYCLETVSLCVKITRDAQNNPLMWVLILPYGWAIQDVNSCLFLQGTDWAMCYLVTFSNQVCYLTLLFWFKILWKSLFHFKAKFIFLNSADKAVGISNLCSLTFLHKGNVDWKLRHRLTTLFTFFEEMTRMKVCFMLYFIALNKCSATLNLFVNFQASMLLFQHQFIKGNTFIICSKTASGRVGLFQ